MTIHLMYGNTQAQPFGKSWLVGLCFKNNWDFFFLITTQHLDNHLIKYKAAHYWKMRFTRTDLNVCRVFNLETVRNKAMKQKTIPYPLRYIGQEFYTGRCHLWLFFHSQKLWCHPIWVCHKNHALSVGVPAYWRLMSSTSMEAQRPIFIPLF